MQCCATCNGYNPVKRLRYIHGTGFPKTKPPKPCRSQMQCWCVVIKAVVGVIQCHLLSVDDVVYLTFRKRFFVMRFLPSSPESTRDAK